MLDAKNYDATFFELYFDELFGLATSLSTKCQQVFDSTIVPESGFVLKKSAEVHSVISSLLSDAANIKKLSAVPSVKPPKMGAGKYDRQVRRAKKIGEFLAPLNIDEIFNNKVRNTLEHFDEYLDDAIHEFISNPHQGGAAAYNIILSHWESVVPKVYPIRLYISSEKKFYNMKWSVDIGKMHLEALSIIEKMRRELNYSEPSAAFIFI